MTAADTTTAIGGDVEPRRRGKSKVPNFTYDGPVSVIGLELDVSDARVRRRVERQWAAAKSHIEASGWMRDHLTKAIGLHVANEVWDTVDRHLFADASGHRHGPPRIGSWWDFTRIPGRARSHTKATPVWETYRLVGGGAASRRGGVPVNRRVSGAACGAGRGVAG